MEVNVAEELRSDVREILKKAKVPADNLSHDERMALRSLKRKKKDVVFTKADKGNTTVVMDLSEYREKLRAITSGDGFTEMKKDITEMEGRKLSKLLMECEKKGQLERVRRLSLTVKALRCPILFGLPKLHKSGVPLRPIVSYVDSPTYFVAKELARILRPIHGNSNFNIKNSSDMCDFLHGLNVPDNCVLASYDVINLFGLVPAEEAADLAIKRLQVDESLSERTSLTVESISKLLLFCVRSNYFVCNGVYFRTSTCPMGSPLSPALASVFMENLEDKIIRRTNSPVIAWKRYVDDSFAVIKQGEEENVLAELNSYHDSIKFTYEKEKGRELSFLDIKIKRFPEGVNTTVYRKNTSTERYLDFSSSHCNSVKWGLVSCLGRRAHRICREDEDRKRELTYLQEVFKRNGYPMRTLIKRLHRTGSREHREEEQKERSIAVPFVPGISEKVARTVGKLGLRVRFLKGRSLGCILGNTKLDVVPELENGGVVYKQACEDCDLVYIGETGRRAIIRRKEHEKAVKEMDERSAIAEHCHKHNHKVDFRKFGVLRREKDWRRRRIKEGMEILKHSTFNRDEGLHVDKRWRTFIL